MCSQLNDVKRALAAYVNSKQRPDAYPRQRSRGSDPPPMINTHLGPSPLFPSEISTTSSDRLTPDIYVMMIFHVHIIAVYS
jgi:hypothetical protein